MLLCWDGKPKAQLSQKDTLWKANKEKGKNVQTVSFMNEIKKGGHFYDLKSFESSVQIKGLQKARGPRPALGPARPKPARAQARPELVYGRAGPRA